MKYWPEIKLQLKQLFFVFCLFMNFVIWLAEVEYNPYLERFGILTWLVLFPVNIYCIGKYIGSQGWFESTKSSGNSGSNEHQGFDGGS